MSELTRQEVLAKKRERYARAGREHKAKILDELVELFGYHRKAAIRALRPRPVLGAPFVRGRPKEYDPDRLLAPLRAIWLAALQPCGERLKAWQLNFLEHWDPAGYALVGYLGHFNEHSRPEALTAHHTQFKILPGEHLVMCSDGVSDYVAESHPEVAQVFYQCVTGDDPDEIARRLVGLANRGGGGDNATCLVATLFRS